MRGPDYYHDRQGKSYAGHEQHGFTRLAVLTFLVGDPWDEIALAYLRSVRPSYIRVLKTYDEQTNDHIPWRVTVEVNKENEILSIDQEVEVGLPAGIDNGYRLDRALAYRKRRQDAPTDPPIPKP